VRTYTTLAAACLIAAACSAPKPAPGASPVPAPAGSAAAAGANQQLDQLAEEFFEATLALNPTGATSIGDSR
jgi:hypothetical protein